MDVERYAFHLERLKGVHMFNAYDLRMSYLFVYDTFKRLVEANNLQGLIFYPIKQEN